VTLVPIANQTVNVSQPAAFTDRERAAAFERYLKSASGRTVARKRL